MRRFKQQLSTEETERILRNGKYCVMAVSGDDDYPYAVPVNYVFDGTSIYIHSAAQVALAMVMSMTQASAVPAATSMRAEA